MAPHKNAHTQIHMHADGGGGVEEQLGDSLVTVSWVACQQALTWSSLT